MHSVILCGVISIFLSFLSYINSIKTQSIHLGGLFSPFNADGTRNETGAQGLASFLMAINEINARTDLLPNHNLEYIVADPNMISGLEGSTTAGLFLSTGVVGGHGVDLVIGGVDNYPTIQTNQIFNNYAKVQISSVASSAELSVGSDYPYKFRVVPSDSFSGMANQYFVLHRMGYRRVLAFTLDDFTQSKAEDDLNDQTWAVPTFLDQIVIDPTKTRYTKAILQAKATGAQVFVLYLDAGSTGRLLEQGYNLGLFKEGTIVFGCFENSGPAVYKSMSASAPVAKIMKGYLGIERIPNYSVLNTVIGQQFVTSWRAQIATISTDGSGNTVCPNVTDAAGTSLLSRNISGTIRCAGYDFSTFATSGSTLDPAAPHTYDAVYAAAYGLHSLFYKVGAVNVTSNALMQELKVNVSFYGTTGFIEFNSGMVLVNGIYMNVGDLTATDDGVNSGGLNDYFARGDRETGSHFKILNFNEASYNADKVNGGFVQVGLFNVEDRFQLCGDPSTLNVGAAYTCTSNVIYNTADNSKPLERPPIIYRSMIDDHLQIILIICILVGFLVVITLSSALYVHRDHSNVKSVQPSMIVIIMLGMIVGLVRAMIPLFPVSTTTCVSELVIGHFAFMVVFVTLYVKTWRISRLMKTSSKPKKKVTNIDALKLVGVGIGGMAVLIMIVAVVEDIVVKSHYSDSHNQIQDNLYCEPNYPDAKTSLFIVEIILMLLGASLAQSVSDLPGTVNESKSIFSAMLCIVIIGGVIYPVSSVNILDPIFTRFITALSFSIAVMAASIALYGNRVYTVVYGGKIKKVIQAIRRSTMAAAEQGAEEKKQLLRISNSTVKAIKDENAKIEFCTTQIQQWYAYLAVLNDVNGKDENHALSGIIAQSQQVQSEVRMKLVSSGDKLSTSHHAKPSGIGSMASAILGRGASSQQSQSAIVPMEEKEDVEMSVSRTKPAHDNRVFVIKEEDDDDAEKKH